MSGRCNGAASPGPPLSGEVDSDAAGTTKIVGLGLGCLYIGGGTEPSPPRGFPRTPRHPRLARRYHPDGELRYGTGDCSRGPQDDEALRARRDIECTTDLIAWLPGPAATPCFFGPPVLINGFPSSCVVNTFAEDASGTIDLRQALELNINLASRIYLTLGQPTSVRL